MIDYEEDYTSKSKSRVVILGITIVILVAIGVYFVFFRYGSPGFKSNLNSFLLEAEKINIMTEQGVTKRDFSNQLVEVKSSYSLLKNSWPSSMGEEEELFEKALQGWDLTLTVWDYDLDSYLSFTDEALSEECTTYIDVDPDVALLLTVEDWIGILMGTASQYFDEGKVSVDSKIK